MKDNNASKSEYQSGNKFFILHHFNDELRKGIIVPLTDKIYELARIKDSEIDIYINSRGGDAMVCMHIISLIEYAKSKGITVRTIVLDTAFSAGSMVAIAGTKGERYIARTAEHVAHYGHHSGWTESTPLQTERNAEYKKRWFAKVRGHYKKYAKIPNLNKAMDDDSFFIPANQAILWGMADKYMEELK